MCGAMETYPVWRMRWAIGFLPGHVACLLRNRVYSSQDDHSHWSSRENGVPWAACWSGAGSEFRSEWMLGSRSGGPESLSGGDGFDDCEGGMAECEVCAEGGTIDAVAMSDWSGLPLRAFEGGSRIRYPLLCYTTGPSQSQSLEIHSTAMASRRACLARCRADMCERTDTMAAAGALGGKNYVRRLQQGGHQVERRRTRRATYS